MPKFLSFRIRKKKKKAEEKSTAEDIFREDASSLETTLYERVVSLRADYRILESYPLYDPWARALILERKSDGSLLYFVDEIPLTQEEREIYNKILDILYWELEPAPPDVDPKEHFRNQATSIIKRFAIRFKSTIHPGISWGKIQYYILRDTVEYDVITPLMKDPAIEDISCDGVGRPIYVWHQRYESMPTNIRFTKEEELDSLVVKLAHKAGKHVSVAFPIVDAILPEGHRLAATYKKEVSKHGSTFTIRKFREKPLSVIHLIQGGTISSLLAAYFWKLMEYNMTGLIMGVTGAGKTTMLNALATLLRPNIKIVTIEDTPELRLTHENWVQLYSRPSYGFEAGMAEISLYDLVRVSLRYRPDVLIVGETRGEEAKVLFQAVASVSWDTPVLVRNTQTGEVNLVPIGEFVDAFYAEGEERVVKEVHSYDVLSHNGYTAVWAPVRYVLRHSVDTIYRIETEGGAIIEATENHSVFVLDPETLAVTEKRVDELKEGELLISFKGIANNPSTRPGSITINVVKDPETKVNVAGNSTQLIQLKRTRLTPENTLLDEDMAFVLGVYLADGCVKTHRGKRICFTLGASEEEYLERVLNVMKSKFNATPYIDDRGTYKIVEYSNTQLAELFEKLAGAKLAEKRIPPPLWTAERQVVKAFFEGLAADARRTDKQHRYLNIVTANRTLAHEIIWLARVHGFASYYREEPGTGRNVGKTYYNIYVYLDEDYIKPDSSEKIPVAALLNLARLAGAKSMPYEFTYIRNRKYVSKKTALKVLEWIRKRGKLEDEALALYHRIIELVHGNLHPLKIKRITKVRYDKGYVYDISVPGTESFFGGNVPVLLHNTGHGGITTIHAEHIDAAVKRLTSPPMDIPPGYIPLINFALAIKRVRIPTGAGTTRIVRRVTDVWEIRDYEDYISVSRWDPATREHVVTLEESILLPRIADLTGQDVGDVIDDVYRREIVLRWMAVKGITHYEEVASKIMEFYRRPEKLVREASRELERLESYT